MRYSYMRLPTAQLVYSALLLNASIVISAPELAAGDTNFLCKMNTATDKKQISRAVPTRGV